MTKVSELYRDGSLLCFPGQENDDNVEREQRIAGPKFDLLATATLRLEEAGEEVPELFSFFQSVNSFGDIQHRYGVMSFTWRRMRTGRREEGEKRSWTSFLPCLATSAAGSLSNLTAG